jgi:hypothetical protein
MYYVIYFSVEPFQLKGNLKCLGHHHDKAPVFKCISPVLKRTFSASFVSFHHSRLLFLTKVVLTGAAPFG